MCVNLTDQSTINIRQKFVLEHLQYQDIDC